MAKDLNKIYLIDTYSSMLTETQREMMELYYYEDLSLGEIAENAGISRQGVRDSIKRGETAIDELEEKLGFAKKYRDLHKLTERIRQDIKEITLYNDKFSAIEQIDSAANDILAVLDNIEK